MRSFQQGYLPMQSREFFDPGINAIVVPGHEKHPLLSFCG